jgi:uncharacterized protein (TIGR00730 family)
VTELPPREQPPAPDRRERSRYHMGDDDLDDRIEALVRDSGAAPDEDLVFEMVVSCLRMAREDADRAELKLVNSALKELRYSFRVFEPYVGIRKVSLFGSARIKEHDLEYEVARDMGRLMSEAGWMVITGAGPGIMSAGVEGAGLDRSFGVGIRLPFESVAPMFTHDPKLINFRYFFTRKLTFMKESHGFVLLPGGFGTMDEAFELLTLQQTGRMPLVPTVLLDPPGSSYWQTWRSFVEHELAGRGLVSPHDLELIRITDSVEAARDELCGFYEVFHSTRHVGKRIIIRTHQPISDAVLARINTEFADILVSGTIDRVGATEPERASNDHVDLPRLALHFDRRSLARLRVMIDVINGRR